MVMETGSEKEETTLESILAQLDLTLSALRDAIRGTGDKTLTDLHDKLSSVGGTVTVTATDLDIRNLQKALDEIYAVLKTDAGAAYDARQIRALTSSDIVDVSDKASRELGLVGLKAGTNNIGDVDVLSLPESGSIVHFNVSSTTTLFTPTGAAKIKGFFFYTTADMEATLNFATSGDIIGGLSGKGAVGMNLIGMKKPQGATGEAVELTIVSGTGNVKGWVSYEEV